MYYKCQVSCCFIVVSRCLPVPHHLQPINHVVGSIINAAPIRPGLAIVQFLMTSRTDCCNKYATPRTLRSVSKSMWWCSNSTLTFYTGVSQCTKICSLICCIDWTILQVVAPYNRGPNRQRCWLGCHQGSLNLVSTGSERRHSITYFRIPPINASIRPLRII